MKKALLTTALVALMGFSTTYAQEAAVSRYSQGASVASIDDLTSGTYFIRAHANIANGDMARGESMVYDNDGEFAGVLSNIYNFTSRSTDNLAYVWEITVSDGELPAGATEGDKVFTIKNLLTGAFWSVLGNNGPSATQPARGSFRKNTFSGNADLPHDAGLYKLVNMPDGYTDYYGTQKDNKRFFLKLTNAIGNYDADDKYPYVHTNQAGSTVSLGYWAGANETGTAVQFDLVKAEPMTSVDVTVNLPALNGLTIQPLTVSVPLNQNPTLYIQEAVNGLNKGGFTITGLTNNDGDEVTTVTGPGEVINVAGTWERGLVAGNVYRLRIYPSDAAHGTIRYMISTGAIETKRENFNNTLNRLVPERFWYFTESDGKYKLHTLYDTTKEVKMTKAGSDWNGAVASLEDEGTEFEIAFAENGYFHMKMSGETDAWVNDYKGRGKLSIWHSSEGAGDSAGYLSFYGLTDDDFAELANVVNDEDAINAAKANPTVENVKDLVEAYNANNVEAALKRVEYIVAGSVGNNPGQYSDSKGEFVDAVETLRAIAADQSASDDDIQAAIAAVNDMIAGTTPDNFTFNEMTTGFYRFRTKLATGRYLSSISGGSAAEHTAMGMTDDATKSNTVFYVEAKDTNDDPAEVNYTVICFDNGLVLPNLNGSSWMPGLQGATGVSENVNFNYQNDGCYVIHVGTKDNGDHRHFHGGTGDGLVANAGSATDDGYRWHIERVTELPLTFYNVMGQEDYEDEGWTSVYSPVALEVPSTYTHTTAYVGVFDDADYTGKPDVNHIHATPIKANDEGKVIIPANQPALIYYDGGESADENPNLEQSEMNGRTHITYLNFPIVGDYQSEGEIQGNLKGGFLATPRNTDTDFFTLHASHNNNFREYSKYLGTTSYDYIPGFKVYVSTAHNDEDTFYPIYLHNPNKMVAVDGDEGFKYEVSEDNEGDVIVTVTTSSEEYDVYYKHAAPSKQSAQRRVADHTGYEQATKNGNVHTFTVQNGDNVDYYAYHAGDDFQGVVRSVNIDTTGIDEISAEGSSAKVYDLQGRKLAAPAKGINIINGKKVLVK